MLKSSAILSLALCLIGCSTEPSGAASSDEQAEYPVQVKVVKLEDVANSCIVNIEITSKASDRIKQGDLTFEVYDASGSVIGGSRIYVANLMPDRAQVDHPVISMVPCGQIDSIGNLNPGFGGLRPTVGNDSAISIKA